MNENTSLSSAFLDFQTVLATQTDLAITVPGHYAYSQNCVRSSHSSCTNRDNAEPIMASKDEVMPVADWDKTAQQYSDNIARFTALHAADLTGALYHDILSAKTILDVGCGTGAFGLSYVQQFPKGIPGQTLILSDLSPGMVNKTKDVMQQRVPVDFKTKLQYEIEDGAVLEGIQDDSIDVLVSVFGVFLIPDRAKTFNTIQRVLRKPDGVFGASAWTSIECRDSLKNDGFGAGLHDSMETSLKDLTNPFSNKEAPWKQWFNPDTIRSMVVDEAGFGTVAVHRSIHSVMWPSALDLWQLISGSPMSKVTGADQEMAEAAKQSLIDMVNYGDANSPVLVWTASNLVVARGPPSE